MIVEKTGYKLSDVNSKSRNNFIHSIRPEVIIDREFKKTMTAKGGNSKGNGNGNGNVAKQIKRFNEQNNSWARLHFNF